MNHALVSLLLLTAFPYSGQGFTPAPTDLLAASRATVAHQHSRKSPRNHQSWGVVRGDSLIHDEHRDDSRNGKTEGSRRWPRRLWSHLTRRGTAVGSATAPLQMMSIDAETEALLESISEHYNEEFIMRNFEELTPNMVLPKVGPPALDSEYYDVSITQSSNANANVIPIKPNTADPSPSPQKRKNRTSIPRSISLSGLIARLMQNILTGIIVRNTTLEPENLKIQAFPRGNLFLRLVRGTINTDARIETGRLVFPAIRLTSGSLEIKRMALNVMGFLPNQGPTVPRYPKQFDLHADDLTFSREDLFFSNCIRNGLQNLLVRILRDRGVKSSTINVSSIDILSSGKISVKGEAKTLFDSPLSFEVRTKIATSSRGHVLTFPGLEVALNRELGLFVPVVPVIDLDIGHNARLRKVDIDGKEKRLRLSASVTITPTSTIRLHDYVQISESFAARFSYDVGQWLTELGNFSR